MRKTRRRIRELEDEVWRLQSRHLSVGSEVAIRQRLSEVKARLGRTYIVLASDLEQIDLRKAEVAEMQRDLDEFVKEPNECFNVHYARPSRPSPRYVQ